MKTIIVSSNHNFAVKMESVKLDCESVTNWKNVFYSKELESKVIISPNEEQFCKIIGKGAEVGYNIIEVSVPCLEELEPHTFYFHIPAERWLSGHCPRSDILPLGYISRRYGGKTTISVNPEAWSGRLDAVGRIQKYDSHWDTYTQWKKPDIPKESFLLLLAKSFLCGGVIKFSENKAEGFLPWYGFYYIETKFIKSIQIEGIDGSYL